MLYLVAGSGQTMLEREALHTAVPDWDDWYRIHICADASAFVVKYLALRESPECSDDLFRVWVGEDAQVVLTPDHAPSIAGTVVATRRPGDLLEVVGAYCALIRVAASI